MNKLHYFLILLFVASTSFAQRSFNMTYLSEYFPPTLTPGDAEGFNDIWGWVDSAGREYAIFGSRAGTYFVDVTDPANPVEVDYKPGGFNGAAQSTFWRDYKTYKNYCYAVVDGSSTGSLQIFDLSYLPDSVHEVYNDNEFTTSAHNVHINNDRVYLISNSRGGSYYPLDILCIEDPENPELIGGIWNNNTVTGSYSTSHDIFVKNDTVYMSVYFNQTGNNGLHVFDTRDPMNPDLLGSITNYPVPGINHASWMFDDGNHLLMMDETRGSPVKIIDISDLSNMNSVATFATDPGSIAHNGFIKDCLAFVSYYHDGVQVYDVSDPLNPTRVGYFDTDTTTGDGVYNPNFLGCWGVYPYFPSGNIIASDREYGLFTMTFDGTFPANCSGDEELVLEVDTARPCVDTASVNPNAIAGVVKQDVKVYPNPSQGIFNIDLNSHEVDEILVFDLAGNIVYSERLRNDSQSIIINLSSQKQGMYILELVGAKEKQRFKIFNE